MNLRKPLSKKQRFEILKRDGFVCQYCGRGAPESILHIDHIVPVAMGGDNDSANLITACLECNAGKGVTFHDPQLAEIYSLKQQIADHERDILALRCRAERAFEYAGRNAEALLHTYAPNASSAQYEELVDLVWETSYREAESAFIVAKYEVGDDLENIWAAATASLRGEISESVMHTNVRNDPAMAIVRRATFTEKVSVQQSKL